jgi:hypothetical protein
VRILPKETIIIEEKDVIEESMEEEEIKHAEQYIGKYVIANMSFGQKSEAQYSAMKISGANADSYEIDAWKFRFQTLIQSLKEVPTIGSRKQSWSANKKKQLEFFIYNAPPSVGDKLMAASDRLNKYAEEERKN